MKVAKIIAIVFAVIIVVLLGVLIFVKPAKGPTGITPPSAQSPDGSLRMYSPITNGSISSPVAINGDVTGGGWFFEATFPIKVLDGDGTVIGNGVGQALSDWTSTGTVSFSANISFTAPQYATGTILFANDNPSGLPQNQKTFSVPVQFVKNPQGTTGGGAGTVQGQVLLSPTCPVERIPPEPGCAPKPYQTTVAISRNIETPSAFETIQSSASGTFSASLPAGEYDFYIKNNSALPRCDEHVVTVSAGTTSNITINCDTGIR